MGCRNSNTNNEKELYNEDVNVRDRFLFGVHVSKDPEGIEGNIQLACGTIRKKKYERVANRRDTGEQEEEQPAEQPAQQIEDNTQTPAQQIEDDPQASAQQIEDNSRDNG